METVYRSAPAKMGPPASATAGTLYLTGDRLVFFDKATAPVTQDGAVVDWADKTPSWALALSSLKDLTAKTTLNGPCLLITNTANKETVFSLPDPKGWAGAIKARR